MHFTLSFHFLTISHNLDTNGQFGDMLNNLQLKDNS